MDYKIKGELSMLRKKYEKLKQENRALKAELSSYQERENKTKQKMVRYSQLCTSLDNSMECTLETDIERIDHIYGNISDKELQMIIDKVQQTLNFDVFRKYCDNEEVFNMFAPIFVRRHPLKMIALLGNVERRKIRDVKVAEFFDKFVRRPSQHRSVD
ncbi:hypothetical protein VCUG_01648 [Vavraia culicis subsp. floridensis]|uniref:Uncharacterized protein n=1 Tax=Vavraia culicis (isolate floridensis) TaxID=948595 RepID=L2GTE4_VAVCU|nr:uncharacterized protein VCUG_01648 [Vavraia culicis subsp. floridensis]ELA46874.1 hypothetical protein VCUG_01648 [Vavraia culicis subsp. floridensis]